ncbi:uncharacterized protein [Antedon mediterranea]|uniref:uncharacterized protein n=1 Tax=Antedon mediterranea TaxID=105859 RepID=UPI003AF6633C
MKENKKVTSKKKENTMESKGFVVVPYVAGLSERVSKVFKEFGINTAMKPHTSLRQLLVHPKDQIDKLKVANCVYEISCSNCDHTYIGETGRCFGTRLNEHRKETEKITQQRKNFTRQSHRECINTVMRVGRFQLINNEAKFTEDVQVYKYIVSSRSAGRPAAYVDHFNIRRTPGMPPAQTPYPIIGNVASSFDRCLALDGVSRPSVTTNYTIPGPTIEVCEGDTVQVKLLNNLQDRGAMTIHWYGMHQEGTNWMDGVSMITQCPVASSSSFVYEFTASPAGTHWYHGHSGYMRNDGMYGALIVKKNMQYEYNSHLYDFDLPEHVMMIADWKERPTLSTYLMTDSPTIYVDSEAQKFSILINGRAQEEPFYNDHGDVFYTPLSTFEVEVGMTYRFRMISAAFALCNLVVSIQSHPLTVVAVDGSEVVPEEVDSILIAPGERYDFLLKATAKPALYCIYYAGSKETECVDDGVAILKYTTGANVGPSCYPVSKTPETLTNTPQFSVLDALPLVLERNFDKDLYTIDVKYYITLSYCAERIYAPDGRLADGNVLSYFEVDNVAFLYPDTPILFNRETVETCEPTTDDELYQSCDGITVLCRCTSILKIPLGKVVELVIANQNSDDYSVHMHGASARVVGMGRIGSLFTKDELKELDEQGLLTRISPDEAVIKDTVNVPAYGYVILRWKADNPGYWLFNAVTNSHLETGQAMIFQVGEMDEIPQPPGDMPTCGPWKMAN